jgi:hypothetical protein
MSIRATAAVLAVAVVFAAPVGASGSAADPIIKSGAGPGWPKTLRASDFVRHVTNPWFPLRPGSKYRYRGVKEGKAMVDVMRPTHRTKIILGVKTTVVHDEVLMHGKPREVTKDYYAQDRRGNVWYFGEDTKEYENGKVATTEGSWQAGVDGAEPGVVVPADPEPGLSYREEYYAGEAEDECARTGADAVAVDTNIARVLSRVFRVRGQGMPVLGGRGKGDLFVSVSVITPTSLTREQRKLLEQLAKIETKDLEDKKLVDKVRDIFG